MRQNAHQPLRDLGPMAFSVLRALASRLEREGRLVGPAAQPHSRAADGTEFPAAGSEVVERPPLAKLRAAA